RRGGRWTPPSELRPFRKATRGQLVRSQLKLGVADGLIEHMVVAHLRRVGADDFLPGRVAIAPRVAGINEIAVAIDAPPGAAECSCQQARAAQGLGDESFHDTLLNQWLVVCGLWAVPTPQPPTP